MEFINAFDRKEVCEFLTDLAAEESIEFFTPRMLIYDYHISVRKTDTDIQVFLTPTTRRNPINLQLYQDYALSLTDFDVEVTERFADHPVGDEKEINKLWLEFVYEHLPSQEQKDAYKNQLHRAIDTLLTEK